MLGYWLGEEYWGKGITSEAVKMVLDYGFSDFYTEKANKGCEVVRIEAIIFAENEGSAGVLKKNGFVCEGRQRAAYKKGGKLYDGMLFAKIRESSEHA